MHLSIYLKSFFPKKRVLADLDLIKKWAFSAGSPRLSILQYSQDLSYWPENERSQYRKQEGSSKTSLGKWLTMFIAIPLPNYERAEKVDDRGEWSEPAFVTRSCLLPRNPILE